MDRLDALRLFCQIVDTGSLVKAAKVLGLSPTKVTQNLAKLEKIYNTRLLERTTRRIAVTEAGMVLYERAKHLLEQAASLEAAVCDATEKPKGSLRVTLPLGVATTFIYPRIGEFTARYPEISLDLQVSDQIVDLVAGNFDIGLRAGLLADANVIALPLLRYRRITCASPAYLRQHGTPAFLEDLKHHTCLIYRHDTSPVSWRYWHNNTYQTININGNYASNESFALIAMARSGLGIIRQPDWLLASDLREGKLIEILDQFNEPLTPEAPGIYAIIQHRRYRPAKVDAFMEFVRNVIGEWKGLTMDA
ncbi:LysR family transcriptional regulator [Leeia oryzae]|uniref:LysR family transcriptional regulator n=1 Tax=Leeia oryzae TaxID=356662 RepID=UPI0003748C85|nr:LysR family transcriptional regulator [Leeia oryzae]